jgi:hypothetical protein
VSGLSSNGSKTASKKKREDEYSIR